ncbi:MAG TPA: sulfite exporter TauE/SafE family protein [Roseiarcus sp.]|nr:sulfite exporter TauE/SafE family protein [Roseiarcus sp.]
MTPPVLALLPLVGFGSGFVDAIAGGGGLLTLPSLALAGLDPVAAVATNKLASTFGSGSATLAFCRAGKVERAMTPSAAAACAGAALGAIELPWAPWAFLSQALPVALCFAFAPNLTKRNATRAFRLADSHRIWRPPSAFTTACSAPAPVQST